jgi:dynein heavy chain
LLPSLFSVHVSVTLKTTHTHTHTSHLTVVSLSNPSQPTTAIATTTATRTQDRYEAGLEKIAFAEGQVGTMQHELEVLQPKLVVAKEENATMTAQIQKESAAAAEMEVVITADEADANEKAAVAKGEKEECEALLAEAIPALNSALKALDTLKKSDMDELKGIKLPTDGVRLVMEAVCVLKEVAPVKIDDPKGGLKKVGQASRCLLAREQPTAHIGF